MDKRIKQKWVKALRSGDYKQYHGALSSNSSSQHNLDDDVSFCCLGVLCDLFVEEHRGELYPETIDGWHNDGMLFHCYELLPPDVSRWAGIEGDAMIEIDGMVTEIVTANDDLRCSFDELANYIEQSM